MEFTLTISVIMNICLIVALALIQGKVRELRCLIEEQKSFISEYQDSISNLVEKVRKNRVRGKNDRTDKFP